MKSKSNSRIAGLGVYLPERRLTNQDLEKMVDTSNEWIVRRTGVKERRMAAEGEFASDLAIKAIEMLLEQDGVVLDDVDMLIVSTFTPDHFTPTVSGMVAGHFGIHGGTMDMNSGCTGSVYAMCLADSLITAGHCRKVLVVASEAPSKVMDYTDRNTCILFGDAAVALLLERSEGQGHFSPYHFVSDGTLAHNITCSNLANKVNGREIVKQRLFEQEGKFLYEYVVKNVPEGVNQVLAKSGHSLGDIQWFVPHSANLRMIKAICDRLDFPIEQTLISNEYYGNTSSASIPLAIWQGIEAGKVKRGDKLLLYGFGAGLTHGGVIVTW